uniref:Leucine rich repeat containing 56 n=1 Tax=Neolamprologus brichardi TaxID=32507 RepID=A0A3Q4GVZ6_NEOBR
CGTQDLSNVTSLEICVDTQENTLGNFGKTYNMSLIKYSTFVLFCLPRDLGTTISQLQVLWMSRCCLRDLDGITTFCAVTELYLSYNNVSDLSQVGMLENLQLLDLEGNDVDDLVEVQYLSLCSKLERLTLEGNPVCLCPNPTSAQMADYSYRAAVRELVPQLRYLDDVKVEEDRLSCCTTMGEDWDILRNSIRDSNSSYPAGDGVCVFSITDACFTLSIFEGAGNIVFCGNPVQAIRAKRQKLRVSSNKVLRCSGENDLISLNKL